MFPFLSEELQKNIYGTRNVALGGNLRVIHSSHLTHFPERIWQWCADPRWQATTEKHTNLITSSSMFSLTTLGQLFILYASSHMWDIYSLLHIRTRSLWSRTGLREVSMIFYNIPTPVHQPEQDW